MGERVKLLAAFAAGAAAGAAAALAVAHLLHIQSVYHDLLGDEPQPQRRVYTAGRIVDFDWSRN